MYHTWVTISYADILYHAKVWSILRFSVPTPISLALIVNLNQFIYVLFFKSHTISALRSVNYW